MYSGMHTKKLCVSKLISYKLGDSLYHQVEHHNYWKRTTCKHRNRKQWNSFFWSTWLVPCIVVHVFNDENDVVQHGSHTRANTKSWFRVYIFDFGHPYYDQLTPVKTRYLMTSVSQSQVYNALRSRVFLSWPLTKCWLFDWILGSSQANLL